ATGYAASRSGPVAAVTVRRAKDPGASDSGTDTMPSISGASRWVRPTPGVSMRMSTSRPTIASRRRAVMRACNSERSQRRTATKRTEDRLRGVLQREVEVGPSRAAHRVDEGVVELARIEVEEPRARHSLRNRLYERHDGALLSQLAGAPEVSAVRGEVLGDEH